MAISLTVFYGSPNAHNGAAASLGSIARASQKLNAIALSQFRVSLNAVLFLTSLAPCGADPAPIIHYAPAENLEHIDVALIDRAEREIDMAAYVLTDWPVMQALTRAADRGVAIRIYLDGTQLAEREPAKAFNDLAETPGVEIRIKRKNSDLMHLKSYQIDGRLVRTGAANFSASGLKRQDNDLIVIESAGAAASWTLLKTWPSSSISDSLLEDGLEVIRCAGSPAFLMSMIG
ncbi:MAG: phospholipase D-like domain-containing protein [Pseudomonadota bacterium]|nr:phospholipase D-like domain-containing protein [Pseudomonadota bacterium]